MVEDDNQFLEVLPFSLKETKVQNLNYLGNCTWNRACLEGDEAVDEECRQDVEQLSGPQLKSPISRMDLIVFQAVEQL